MSSPCVWHLWPLHPERSLRVVLPSEPTLLLSPGTEQPQPSVNVSWDKEERVGVGWFRNGTQDRHLECKDQTGEIPQKKPQEDFPGGPVVKTPASKVWGSDPAAGWGTKVSHAAAKNKKQKWNNFRQISERMALRLLDPEGMCPSPVQMVILTQRETHCLAWLLCLLPSWSSWKRGWAGKEGGEEIWLQGSLLGALVKSSLHSFVYSVKILLCSDCVSFSVLRWLDSGQGKGLKSLPPGAYILEGETGNK